MDFSGKKHSFPYCTHHHETAWDWDGSKQSQKRKKASALRGWRSFFLLIVKWTITKCIFH